MSVRKFAGLRIDIETKSGTPIKAGSYRYSEDPDFGVLVVAYCPIFTYPDGTEKLGAIRKLNLSLARDVDKFKSILVNSRFQKHAFNANFERISLSRWMGMPTGTYLDPANWRCSAVKANVGGVFGSLDEVARSLRTSITKDPEGRRLIKMFSSPDSKSGRFHKPGKTCWCGTSHAADFAHFERYCENDVLTEAVVARALPEVPDPVQAQYEADQRINDRGVRHFSGLSSAAMVQVEAEKVRLMGELKNLTGLDNPNSVKQMREWLDEQGYPMTSLDKEHREVALADPFIPEEVAEALTLRGSASLSSVVKHKAALDTRCADGRIRGSLQFYGAHTGREAGRGIQPQNLPRYEAPAADRRLLLEGKAGAEAPRIAKGTVRSSLVPAKGHVFVVADYNAIEARCLGWLSGEKWVNDEFAGAGKIYEATASTMFGVDKDLLVRELSACGKCGSCQWCDTRSKGKVSNLALGYAGGAGALVVMGAEAAGIDIGNYATLNAEWRGLGSPGKFHEWESDRHDYPDLLLLRDAFRDASPMTVRFWKLCTQAWDRAALEGQPLRFGNNDVVTMLRDGRHNRMVLPSGRSIWYRSARSHRDKNNPDRVDYRTYIGKGVGVGHTRIETHGGKLCVSGDALTLTERGWIPLRDVLPSDQVWDGVEFVAQDGLIFKGVKPVIDIEGVRMTPDHRIMQTGGWREAQQYDRSDWQDVGLPDSGGVLSLAAPLGRTRRTADLAGALHVRQGVLHAEGRGTARPARGEGASEVVRLPAGRDDFQNHLGHRGRTEQTPALQPVAHGEVPLHEADRPGVGQLRRAWDHHVRPLAVRLLGVRRGHGTDVAAGADTGPDGQRRPVRTGELPVGHGSGAGEQQEAVYDLLNCGPRNRFTVLTERGPMLVHNCENVTQAVARDVLFDLIMRIEDMTAAGWPGRTILHVHDEVVLEVPEAHAEQVLDDALGLMGVAPDWAPGLRVKGEGSIMERYGK